jgi:hypothetical protein
MDDMQEGLEAMQRDLEAILLMVAQDWRKFNKELLISAEIAKGWW